MANKTPMRGLGLTGAITSLQTLQGNVGLTYPRATSPAARPKAPPQNRFTLASTFWQGPQ